MSQTFIHEVMHFDTPATSTLSQEECVTALESKLYNLCHPAKVFDGVKIPHAKAHQLAPPPATNNNAAMPNASAINDNAAPAQPASTAEAPEPPVTNNVPTVNPPLHPYSIIPSHYQPSVNQNFGAPDKCLDPAYQSMPPIYDIEQSKKVFERVLQTKLTVLVGELCSISNDIRNQLRTAVTPK